MTTPYDTARRIGRRDLDTLREALGEAEARQAALVAEAENAAAMLAHERSLAACDPRIDVGPYADAKRAEIERLGSDLGRIGDEVEQLRSDLLKAFEALKPLDFASDDYLAATRRRAARIEQAKLDEVAARRR